MLIKLRFLIPILLAALLAGCNFTLVPQATPTVQAMTPTTEPTLTATPTATPTVAPLVESPTPTATLAPPTETLTPSPTPGPYEHTIKENETLITIVQQYGYTDLSVAPGSIIDQVVRMNDNIPNADTLPGPGNVILIPRQTATPTPGNEATAVVVQATSAAAGPVVTLPGNATINDYIVQPNDTFVGIAQEYNTTIEVLAVLNPDVNIYGCNFEIPSGGPDCNPSLQIGQVLRVPAPTPTPTLSPTPSGNETATPTPTYPAPLLSYPPQGAIAPPGVFSLQWVGVGVLADNEYYLVEVSDITSGQVYRHVTKDTSWQLQEDMIPTDGQTHTIEWTVRLATPNEQGVYRPIGGAPEIRSFQWQSR
ncbi:MAG: LysM peptidoglycan-binding domain-containing protein [Chloroflexi bacterium]|nr:LysM peptidoglycan-binding domain-containing protein [Chloroflexota bacterium]